jgi:hypothetical protein
MTWTVEIMDGYLNGGVPTPIAAYVEGAIGSLATEIAAAVKLSTTLGGACPQIYKKPFYLFARLLFAFTAAGLLPVMMAAQSHWSAFYFGITAPLLFDRLAKGQKAVAELGCAVITTVTHMGWQFPGSHGPGKTIFEKPA